MLHEPFRKLVLQFLPLLRAGQILRKDGDRAVGPGRPVLLGKVRSDLAKGLLRFLMENRLGEGSGSSRDRCFCSETADT